MANDLVTGSGDASGFLGTRGSFMLDLVFVAMFVALPAMFFSIWLARYRSRYAIHKKAQIMIGAVLLVTVVAFELEIRLKGWTHRAEPSPFWKEGRWNDWIDFSLATHLMFAIPTPILWVLTIVLAWWHFGTVPTPGPHSRVHVILGRISAASLGMTAVTGWIFYWLAFAAR
jgi:hypothetical protein